MKLSFIIAYDICNEKRLKNISKYLEKSCIRIQYSIYFIYTTRKEIKQIITNLTKLIDDNDDIRIYRVNMKKSIFLKSSLDIQKLII